MKKIKIICLILALVCLMTSCAASGDDSNNNDKEKITMVLDWTPNTNHTGLYVALEKGYYEQAGLDVSIEQPPEDGALSLVAANKAQFAISFQESIGTALSSENPLDVVAVASIIDHNDSGMVSLKKSNINSPKNMEGKTYATWDTPLEKAVIEDIMEKDGGDFNKLNMVPNTVTDVFSALESDIDLVWIFYAWDGIAAEVKGVDINYMDFKEINPVFDFYTPVIASSNEYLENNKEQAERFMQATKKGYEFAIENPQEAADILLKYAPELDAEIVKRSQEYLADKYKGDKQEWGTFEQQRWTAFYDWLYDSKVIDKDISNTGFTNEYIK